MEVPPKWDYFSARKYLRPLPSQKLHKNFNLPCTILFVGVLSGLEDPDAVLAHLIVSLGVKVDDALVLQIESAAETSCFVRCDRR